MRATPKYNFAICVDYGTEIYQFLRIGVANDGSIVASFPRKKRSLGKGLARWDPHSTYHRSGQVHHKSFGRTVQPKQKQEIGNEFKDTENIVITGISNEEAKQIGILCNRERFDATMHLKSSSISDFKYKNYLSVDLAEPNSDVSNVAGARAPYKVLEQRIFKRFEPWIVLTFAEYTKIE